MTENWQKKRLEASKSHQSVAYHEINELIFKERHGRVVTLINGEKLVEFVSCSYLGLDADSRVIDAASTNIHKCGVTFPAARTRIQSESFIILENLLDEIFCHGYSTIFSTLHLAHLGFIPILGSGQLPSFPADKNGFLFILDKTVHASVQIERALMQQFGEVVFVDFSREDEIEVYFQQAKQEHKTPVAIADSIGSMGGVSPVKFLFNLADRYQGYIYLDDAHGMSVYGRSGCGYVLCELNHTFHPRLILASSLSKAFGAIAGVIVLPTKEDAEILKQFCSTYIFSGPPALSIIDSAIASAKIHLSDEISGLQMRLQENIRYFDSLLETAVVNSRTTSPVRGIYIGQEYTAIQFTKKLRERGFAVTAAMYPTVSKNCAMLRVALSALHTKDQIYCLCENIREIFDDMIVAQKHTKNAELASIT